MHTDIDCRHKKPGAPNFGQHCGWFKKTTKLEIVLYGSVNSKSIHIVYICIPTVSTFLHLESKD